MSQQISDKMSFLKKVFWVLLVFDSIGVIVAGVSMLQMFRRLVGYGEVMLGVIAVIVAVMAAIWLFEILAKVFLIRSTSPAFSRKTGRKGYITAAKLLALFNLGAVILNVLSAGGEGATLINQAYLYLCVLAAGAEMIAAVFYLRTVKKL